MAQFHRDLDKGMVLAHSVPDANMKVHLANQMSLKGPVSPTKEQGPNLTIRDTQFAVFCVLSADSMVLHLENCVPG